MNTYRINTAANGIEILFGSKPAEEVRSTLKASGFRWHKSGGYWYAKQTPERLEFAKSLTDAPQAPKAEKQSKAAKSDLSGLENNKKTTYGAEFAATLRAELKARGVSGVTIRSNRSGWTDSITATIKTTAADYRSAEEAAARDGWKAFFRAQEHAGITIDGITYSRWNEGRQTETEKYITRGSRYDDESPESNSGILRAFWAQRIARVDSVSHYHATADNYPEFTTAAFERIAAIIAIIQSFNHDNSDIMTDYFDVGFYLDIDIKKPQDFTPREKMTEEERAQLLEDFAAEEEAAKRRAEEYEREREAAQRAAEAAAEQEKKDRAEIAENITIEDLTEEHRYYISDLRGGIGKESSINELKARADRKETAHIARRVTFHTAEALEKFSRMFLYDFDFIAGMGGTGTNDPRVNDGNISRLNAEQRAAVEWVSVNCIAVYFKGVLQFVINPEGYGYARYVYIPTEETREATPEESTAREKAEAAATVEAFYFPASVEEQAQRLNIGEEITIYQCSDWLCNITNATTGTLTEAVKGNSAQYSGLWLTIKAGRKTSKIFCRDGKHTAIFKGKPLPMPESVTYESVTRTAGATMRKYRDNTEQIKLIISQYADCGIAPLLDTVQR